MFKWTRLLEVFYNFLVHEESYLKVTGFSKSAKALKPIGTDGEPVPWMNYAAIDFLNERLNSNQSMFEYGSGYSTLFFAKRVKEVTSIEYDSSWFDFIGATLNEQKNAEVKYYGLQEGYDNAISSEAKERKYDVILIDGRERVKCAKNSFDFLSDNGVLILDDSDRERYQEIYSFYKEKGFKKLIFTGLKPTGFRRYATTVFYRSNNCFEI
ncbi:MAG: FkbM family methyltransferase [Reichenbachiella sp.]|uniref:FkbM family methyltransferase n=1 Tax=Reichenbachiella sp. TaxID=2184521 RepID=UPI0032997011